MMDDKLLRQIGDALRDEDFLDDPRWTRLTEAGMSAEEIERFRVQLAERPDGPCAERLEAAIEAFRPLGERTLAKLERLFHDHPDQGTTGQRTELAEAAALTPRVRPSWLGWGVPLAAAIAAAVLLCIALWPPAALPLPTYELEFRGGDRTVRGQPVRAAGPVVELTPRSRIEIRLRPATRAQDPESLTVLGFLRAPGGDVQPLEMPFAVSTSGTLSIEGQVSRLLPVAAGRYDLLLVVVRSGLREAVSERIDALPSADPQLPGQVFTQSLSFVAE